MTTRNEAEDDFDDEPLQECEECGCIMPVGHLELWAASASSFPHVTNWKLFRVP